MHLKITEVKFQSDSAFLEGFIKYVKKFQYTVYTLYKVYMLQVIVWNVLFLLLLIIARDHRIHQKFSNWF